LPNLQALAPHTEPTIFQLQYKAWEYTGWTDTKFVRARDFGSLVDLPRFYETMGLGADDPYEQHEDREFKSDAGGEEEGEDEEEAKDRLLSHHLHHHSR